MIATQALPKIPQEETDTILPTIASAGMGLPAPQPSPMLSESDNTEITKLNPDDFAVNKNPSDPQQVVSSLAAYIREQFNKAKNARQQSGVDEQMMRAKRARELQYDPTKLAQIRSLPGLGPNYDPPYAPLIETKCRDLVSWLLALPPDENPWELEPAVIPDLPADAEIVGRKNLETEIASGIVSQTLQKYGGVLPPQAMGEIEQEVANAMKEQWPLYKDRLMLNMKRSAKELVNRLSITVEGQLDDGKWREELEKCYYDIATYPCAFLVGPLPQIIPMPDQEYDEATGFQKPKITKKVVDTYRRFSPLNVYPSPDSVNIDDGDLFLVDPVEPSKLYDYIGAPGYKEEAIRRVIAKYDQGGLHEWTSFDSERSTLEKLGMQYTAGSGKKIDMICCWVTVPGRMLTQYGMSEDIITDKEKPYSVWAYMVDTEVIMALLNPNPLNKKPVYKASFIEDPDKFWNKSLPDILWHHQGIANAVWRASGHNIAFASGPITELNSDRLKTGESTALYPYAVKLATSDVMKTGGKLMEHYQARLVVNELSSFFNFVVAQADIDSGVPHYIAGGQPEKPGAGKNTLGGMQMMRTDAARGLEQVRANINKGIVSKSVEAQYYQTLWFDGVRTIGGVKVKTRGSEWLAVKDQQSQRIREMLNSTMNPIDMQIFGMKSRQELWRDMLKSMHLDTEKLLPDDKELIANFTGGQVHGDTPDQVAGAAPAGPGQEMAGAM